MLTEGELARRLPVWVALSEIYLDTELQPSDFAHIACRCRESGYSHAELERILANEVAPAFRPNLSLVAGEWAGFPDDTVRRAVLTAIRRRDLLARFGIGRTRRLDDHSRKQWARVLACWNAA